MPYNKIILIFVLVVTYINAKSETYLKNSPREDALFPLAEKSVIGIGDYPSSIGLSYFMGYKQYNINKGDRFGRLVFTGVTQHFPNKRRWLGEFICDCGETKFIRIDIVIRGNERSCGCRSTNKNYRQRQKDMGKDYPFYVLWSRSKKNARIRKIEFSITVDDVKNCYLQQNGCCYYTGKSLSIPKDHLHVFGFDIASMDRIDCSIGYTKENIRMVRKTINFMKYTLSHKEFLETCKQVVVHFLKNNGMRKIDLKNNINQLSLFPI